MGSLSIWHWLIVLLVVVLIFGTKKLRNLGGDVGGAVKSFKDAMNEEKNTPAVTPAAEIGNSSQAQQSPQTVVIESAAVEVPAAKAPAKKRAPAAKKAVANKPATTKSTKSAADKSAAEKTKATPKKTTAAKSKSAATKTEA